MLFARTGIMSALIRLTFTLSVIGAAAGLAAPSVTSQPDGQHDFDFEIGAWNTRVSRLDRPLTGSKTWLTYDGTSIVRTLLDGRANLVELSVAGPAGRIEGVSLRLYHPQSREWALHYANIRDGELTPSVTGRFSDGRGEFRGEDTLDGRAILVRFVISRLSAESWRFEQAFSADGGKSWEVNWIAVDTRSRASHANGAGDGVPASERVGGSGGAKPPGQSDSAPSRGGSGKPSPPMKARVEK